MRIAFNVSAVHLRGMTNRHRTLKKKRFGAKVGLMSTVHYLCRFSQISSDRRETRIASV